MASNYDLKLCPFCGGCGCVQNESITNKHSWKVFCVEGCIVMPADPDEYFASKEKAIEAWNVRAK